MSLRGDARRRSTAGGNRFHQEGWLRHFRRLAGGQERLRLRKVRLLQWIPSLIRVGAGLALLAGLMLPLVARADALDDGVRRVALQLQCPVCQGETVADSPSGLAADMRSVIRTKLAAGESGQQILDEFVGSYGDSILTEPPKRGISLGVWIGPVVALLLGGALVVVLLRTWRRPESTAASIVAVDTDVADEFHRFREELNRAR